MYLEQWGMSPHSLCILTTYNSSQPAEYFWGFDILNHTLDGSGQKRLCLNPLSLCLLRTEPLHESAWWLITQLSGCILWFSFELNRKVWRAKQLPYTREGEAVHRPSALECAEGDFSPPIKKLYLSVWMFLTHILFQSTLFSLLTHSDPPDTVPCCNSFYWGLNEFGSVFLPKVFGLWTSGKINEAFLGKSTHVEPVEPENISQPDYKYQEVKRKFWKSVTRWSLENLEK